MASLLRGHAQGPAAARRAAPQITPAQRGARLAPLLPARQPPQARRPARFAPPRRAADPASAPSASAGAGARSATPDAAAAAGTAADALAADGAAAGGAEHASGTGFKPRAVIVGAGPAGVLSAIYLANRGWKVDIYERRSEDSPSDARRTYLIGLGQRGLRAIEGAGVSLPGAEDRRLLGSVYATPKMRYDDVWSDASRIVGVDRSSLTAQLVRAARAAHPQGIAFHYGASLKGVNFGKRTVTIKTAQGRDSPAGAAGGPDHGFAPGSDGRTKVSYDLLIGADGARSAVRDALVGALPGMQVTPLSSPVAAMEYKAFHGLEDCIEIQGLLPLAAREHPGKRGSYFFAMTNPTPANPSPGSVTLYVNAAGTWSGVMYQPAGSYAAMGSDPMAHAKAIGSLVPPEFPRAWVPKMAAQMAEVDPSGVTPMNISSRIAWPEAGALLIGDASHNVTPQLGQGCNSALEDAVLLNAALGRASPEAAAAAAYAAAATGGAAPAAAGGEGAGAGGPAAAEAAAAAARRALEAALRAYEAKRLPQAHALQRIEEENAWVRRPAAPGAEPPRMTYMRAAWACAVLLLALGRAAARLIPVRAISDQIAPAASLFENVMATTAPYDRLRRFIQLAPPLLAAALVAVVAAAVAAAKAALALLLRAKAAGA